VWSENFFDHHVNWLRFRSLRLQQQPPQPLKILCGVAQPIDMIEPQSLQLVFLDQLSHQAVDGLESAGIFDAQSSKRVDVKKSPVVDIARRQSPVGQPVVLALQQVVQRQNRR